MTRIPGTQTAPGDQNVVLGASATNVRLVYGRSRGPAEQAMTAVAIDELVIKPGERIGLVGPSGAGKTSLLYVLSGIEVPQQGRVQWGGHDLFAMNEGARDRWRRNHAGFVFQDFHLIAGMTPLQNVLAPIRFAHWRPTEAQVDRARVLLSHFGAPVDGRPVERLSRGEQQRVALARALVGSPQILFADEPTASLDQENAALAADQLVVAAEENRCTLLCVTHDANLMQRMDRLITLRNGRIVE